MYKAVIIDDVVLVRDAIKMLGQWDVFGITDVFEADNAQEGLEIIYRENPDLIITDMKMPIMDGTDLLKKLDEKQIGSKVIIISGFSDFKYTKLAIQSKVIDYILKPIDPQDLNNAIAAAIQAIEKENCVSRPDKSNEPTDNRLINDIIAYIDQNYMQEISLGDLADLFFISKEHLSRLFKKETGKNLFSYIMELRLNEARRLLSGTTLTLDDIAYKLGFSNGNYFSKVFKKNIGQSPREYRNASLS